MKKYYNGIQFLRAVSSVCIILFHVWLNTPQLALNGFIFEKLISWMGDFTFLFMMISGFSVCCGYYEKIKNGSISICEFYSKRVKKLWPVFFVMVILEIVASPSLGAFYEGIMDLSLIFSLLPNPEINVIGVAWTMGVIFVFYIFFPYFVYLMQSKKKAWLTTGVFLIIHFICIKYFFTEEFVTSSFWARRNFLYCAVYFAVGGLLYLYSNELEKLSEKKTVMSPLLIIPVVIWLCIPVKIRNQDSIFTILQLIIFSTWIMGGLNRKIKFFANRAIKFISDLSVEIYLSHMVFFQVANKLGLVSLTQNNLINYIICVVFVLTGSILFSFVLHIVIDQIPKKSKVYTIF